jgi:hypothetical protein
VKEILGGNEFTLDKFKSIINSEDDLQRFKDIFGAQRGRILKDLMLINKGRLKNLDKKSADYLSKEYLPSTFESLMESFGTKLQRKEL